MYAAPMAGPQVHGQAANPIDPLLKLAAGERLDAAVEHLIFGRHIFDEGEGHWSSSVSGGRRVPVRPFSTDLETVRLLVGYLGGGFIPVSPDAVEVVIGHRRFRGTAPDVPLAVCRAVLKWRAEGLG